MWIRSEDRDGEEAQLLNLDHMLRISVVEGREPTEGDANQPSVGDIHRATGARTYTVSVQFLGSQRDAVLTRPKATREEAEAILTRILDNEGANLDLNN